MEGKGSGRAGVVLVKDSISEGRRCSDMRKTTVCVGTYGGGSGAAPFRPVPVQIKT